MSQGKLGHSGDVMSAFGDVTANQSTVFGNTSNQYEPMAYHDESTTEEYEISLERQLRGNSDNTSAAEFSSAILDRSMTAMAQSNNTLQNKARTGAKCVFNKSS